MYADITGIWIQMMFLANSGVQSLYYRLCCGCSSGGEVSMDPAAQSWSYKRLSNSLPLPSGLTYQILCSLFVAALIFWGEHEQARCV